METQAPQTVDMLIVSDVRIATAKGTRIYHKDEILTECDAGFALELAGAGKARVCKDEDRARIAESAKAKAKAA